MLVNPNNFSYIVKCSERLIEYAELREIGQGGPTVGRIRINESYVGGNHIIEFGGPSICYKNFLILPYYKRFRFKLCALNVISEGIKFSPNTEKLILIDKLENGAIHYYTDLENKEFKIYSLDELLSGKEVIHTPKKWAWNLFGRGRS